MKNLKNVLILIICLQISIPFAIEESLRFPVFVSHFLHHKNHHEKINFSSFIAQHYSKNHHDENHDEHQNLPFHKDCDYSSYQTLALSLEIIQLKFRKNFNFKEPKKTDFKQNFFHSTISLTIWKPPKFDC